VEVSGRPSEYEVWGCAIRTKKFCLRSGLNKSIIVDMLLRRSTPERMLRGSCLHRACLFCYESCGGMRAPSQLSVSGVYLSLPPPPQLHHQRDRQRTSATRAPCHTEMAMRTWKMESMPPSLSQMHCGPHISTRSHHFGRCQRQQQRLARRAEGTSFDGKLM
jgi:hypothetical protein